MATAGAFSCALAVDGVLVGLTSSDCTAQVGAALCCPRFRRATPPRPPPAQSAPAQAASLSSAVGGCTTGAGVTFECDTSLINGFPLLAAPSETACAGAAAALGSALAGWTGDSETWAPSCALGTRLSFGNASQDVPACNDAVSAEVARPVRACLIRGQAVALGGMMAAAASGGFDACTTLSTTPTTTPTTQPLLHPAATQQECPDFRCPPPPPLPHPRHAAQPFAVCRLAALSSGRSMRLTSTLRASALPGWRRSLPRLLRPRPRSR